MLSGDLQAPPPSDAASQPMTSSTSSRLELLEPPAWARPAPRVDIVIPVYNEQAGLEASVRRLHAFLNSELPFAWRIVIADNASTDGTLAIARGLAFEL